MGRGGKTALSACTDSTSRTRWPAVGGPTPTHLTLSWMTSMVLVEKFARICAMSASHEHEPVSQREGRQKAWLVFGSLHIGMVQNIPPWVMPSCNLRGDRTYSITGLFPCCGCSVGQEVAFCLLFTPLNNISSTGKSFLQSAEVHALQEDLATCRPSAGPGGSPSFPAPAAAAFLHSVLHSISQHFLPLHKADFSPLKCIQES